MLVLCAASLFIKWSKSLVCFKQSSNTLTFYGPLFEFPHPGQLKGSRTLTRLFWAHSWSLSSPFSVCLLLFLLYMHIFQNFCIQLWPFYWLPWQLASPVCGNQWLAAPDLQIYESITCLHPSVPINKESVSAVMKSYREAIGLGHLIEQGPVLRALLYIVLGTSEL